MSDFLARLIARERGDAPMLQPRLASRFEQTEVPLDIPADGLPAASLATPTLPAASVDAHAMHAEPLPAATSSTPAPLAREEPAPASTAPVTMKRRLVAEHPIRETLARARGNEPVHSIEAATAPAPPSPERRGVLVEQRPPSTKLRDEPASQRHAAEPERPDVAPAAHRAGRELATPTLTDAGPVIHVSIGRIEVRAAHASPRTTAQRAAPPASRLDAYLQQRDTGAKP